MTRATPRILWFILFVLARGAVAQTQRPPNFIIIFCDDLGYGDVGAFGATAISTPNLDRMASEGARLTCFYSSANVCTPSRAGLLTGRYPIRSGLAVEVLFPQSPGGLSADELTLADALNARGYKSASIGKWHLGNKPEFWPTANGFDEFFGVPYSNDMKPFPLYRGAEKIEEEATQETLTERYTEEAIRFIEKNREQPFFVYLAHTMPHIPLFVSKKFAGKSKAGLYGDVVERIDWSVGEILGALKRLGLDENTLVIFTSDNGPWYEGSAGQFRNGKGSSFEGGVRVPFIARWPGKIPAGVSSGAMAMNIDLFPTLLKLAGGEAPAEHMIDGKDVWPLLIGGSESPHETLYLFHNDKIAAVRHGRWKLLLTAPYRTHQVDLRRHGFYAPGMLFDLEADPEERFNVARGNPEVVQEMARLLEAGEKELVQPYAAEAARP